jgi:hypothetical protein
MNDCNPNAEALNAALRQFVRKAMLKRELEILRLHGVVIRLRGKLKRHFSEWLEE